MNVQQWREMSGYVERLVAVGAEDIVTTIETDGGRRRPYVSARVWFGKADAVGEPYSDVYLEIGNEAPNERGHLVNCGHVTRRFDSAAEAVEWVEACHIAACFELLEAAGFERGPWGEWHKDGCLIRPHAGYGEPRFDIHAPRQPSDWGPLRSTNMQRADRVLEKTFTDLDLQTLLEFRGWPTADEIEADEEADRLAALLSPEHLAEIDAVLAEVDAGIYPDDGVDADVALEKVRRAAGG